MRPLVVDASVVAAAFLREPHAAQARNVLTAAGELHAPDLIYSELANVLWKRFQRRELTAEEATELLTDLLTLPLLITPAPAIAGAALQAALATGRSVYDCAYLALAVQLGTRFVTADRRLVNALARTPFEAHVHWIGRPL